MRWWLYRLEAGASHAGWRITDLTSWKSQQCLLGLLARIAIRKACCRGGFTTSAERERILYLYIYIYIYKMCDAPTGLLFSSVSSQIAFFIRAFWTPGSPPSRFHKLMLAHQTVRTRPQWTVSNLKTAHLLYNHSRWVVICMYPRFHLFFPSPTHYSELCVGLLHKERWWNIRNENRGEKVMVPKMSWGREGTISDHVMQDP